MIFPPVETLTCDKLLLLMEQLPDWHLDAVTRHIMRALRSQAAGEILLGLPMPALPRPPLPDAAALRVMFEAEIAAQCAMISIPYDAPGPSPMERAWERLCDAARTETDALVYPPLPTPTKAEP